MIGVFDSGVGGLTVLKALRRSLPNQDFLYLGDTARVPYGRKPAAMVRDFALEIGAFLHGRGAEAIVVACNTASAVALTDMQQRFDIPIWGVIEPGVEAAVRATRTGNVGVIGTRGTIASGAYQKRLEARGMKVWAQACPLFVHLVEEDLANSPEAELVAKHYLEGMPDIDTLILGCTHYPVLAPMLSRVLGPRVRLVESALVAAESVQATLGHEGRGSARITHFVTGDAVAYEHTAGVIGGVEGEIIAMPVSELRHMDRSLANQNSGA
ncbi:MAG: glutamate racemase [Acidobacteriota bacterium]|nr:glutamate racemase [Acidobacteriota bacterium]